MNANKNHDKWRSYRDLARLRLMWKRIAVVLSFAVIVGVGYGLSMPAITMSGSDSQVTEQAPNESSIESSEETSIEVDTSSESENVTDEDAADAIEATETETANTSQRTSRRAAATDSDDEEAVIDATDAELIFDELTLQKKATNDKDWTEVTLSEEYTATIDANDKLKVTLQKFEIAAGTLEGNITSVRYQLPDAFVFEDDIEGKLKLDKDKIGTYTIDKEGILTLTFKSKIAQKNIDGDAIFCDVVFETQLSDEATQDTESVVIPFAEDYSLTLNIGDEANASANDDVANDDTIADTATSDNAQEELVVPEETPTAPTTDTTEEASVNPTEQTNTNTLLDTFVLGLTDLISTELPEDSLLTMLANTNNSTPELIVTDLHIKKKENVWDNEWTEVDLENDTIKTTDIIQFTMNYKIPAHILNDGHKYVTYQLPDVLKISKEETGYVRHGNEVIGTYDIDTNGKITITFDEDYVHKDEAGEVIVGDIDFTARLDESKIPSDGEVVLPFSDDLTITIPIQKNETTGKGNVTVGKSARSVDAKTGTVTYRITVWSNDGTSSPVTLTDLMNDMTFDKGSLKVYYNNGTYGETINYTLNRSDETGFDITLPAMKANTGYDIDYTAKVDPSTIPMDGTIVTNTATATSTNDEGKTIGDRRELETRIQPQVLNKTKVSADDNSVTWQIVLNKDNRNLDGWTLSDILNGTAYTGTVNISPSINGQSTITLPYTFGATTDTYTITYTTPATKDFNTNNVTNTARLTKDGKNISSTGSHSDGKENDALRKTANSITEAEDHKTAIIEWTMTVDTSQSAIPAGWVLKDSLGSDQYFTAEQMLAMKQALDATLQAAGYNTTYELKARKGDWSLVNVTDDLSANDTYIGFEITFTDAMQSAKNLTWQYESTAKVEGVDTTKTFSNSATINDKWFRNANPHINYEPSLPSIEKTDAEGKSDNTTHAHNATTDPIEWRIQVRIPNGFQGGDLKVVEHLPEGVTLSQLTISAKDVLSGTSDITQAGTHQIDGYTVQTTISGQDVTIDIPETLALAVKGHALTYVVVVQVDDGFTWDVVDELPSSTFSNSVELKRGDGETIDKDSQSQTINIENGDANKKVVSKAIGTEADGVIPYSIVINPEGEDLIKDSDEIILTDVLKFEENPWYLVALYSLSQKSVHVYYMDENGDKGEELTTDEYSYTYEASPRRTSADYRDPNYGTATSTRTLTFKLPDEVALIVEYKYVIEGKILNQYSTVTNTAELSGFSGNRDHSEKSQTFKISESHAHASTEGTVLYKVDSENHGIYLEGALFELYEYDPDTGDYTIQITKTEDGKTISQFRTDKTGKIEFPEIAYDIAYKLVEIEAPNGYKLNKEPFYFIQIDQTNEKATMPEDFHDKGGVNMGAGEAIMVSNPKAVTVVKGWLDSDGNPKQVTSGSIQVQLEQSVTDATTGEVTWVDYGAPVTITYDTAKEWSYTFDDLPELDDNGKEYRYRVREVATEGMGEFTPDYSDNNEKGITEGTLTIINTEEQTYTLPETGGPGTTAYTLGGISLLLATFALWLYRRRRQCAD